MLARRVRSPVILSPSACHSERSEESPQFPVAWTSGGATHAALVAFGLNMQVLAYMCQNATL